MMEKMTGKRAVLAESTKAPTINVTAQQSRFKTDAADAPPTKEIVVHDLSITIGHRELLSHAELNLQPGRHYVLVGRNGVGKSTLLRAIGTGLVPGIYQSVKVLLLGQVQEEDENDATINDPHETVLQHVIRSDKLRERLLNEARRLSEASESTTDAMAMVMVYRELTRQRLERQVAEAKVIAARQSGARGLQARKAFTKLEEQLAQSIDDIANLSLAEPADLVSETQKALDMLTEVESALATMNASAAAAKASSVLYGLGFPAESLTMSRNQLSGGWRTRCSLACALCQSADLLLLDEPTNFLDLPSIIWLENYIKDLGEETIVVVVTHDRAFADGVAEELLVLRELSLEKFRGNVSAYEIDKLKKYKYLSRMAEAQEKQKKHMQATIDSNVKAAKRAGDDKKLKQAASRKKKLDERMGMQVSAKGTRFKLNRDLAGWHANRRDEIDVPTFDPPPKISLLTAPSNLRHPGALLSFEQVSFAYPKAKKSLIKDVTFTIHPGDRVGLAGLNGSGKSTIVNLAMSGAGGTKIVNPSKGTISRHTLARFGMYSQAATEELTELAHNQPSLTALTHLMEYAGPDLQEKDARALLSSLGLPAKAHTDVPLALLSGGQKVRLALAKVLWTPPHLLILDEVTTHLDSDTIQALALALRSYEGAILVITHDRFFMRCVVEGESPKDIARGEQAGMEELDSDDSSGDEDDTAKVGVVYRLSKGALTKLDGGMQQYESIASKASAKLGKA